jgi:hypothetical protein
VVVPLDTRSSRRLRRGSRKIRVRARARNGGPHDVDALTLRCIPSGGGYCLQSASPPGRLQLTIADPPADVPATADLCLADCDASSSPMCRATGVPLGVSLFPAAGPPRPAILGGVPVCMVEDRTPGVAVSADVATGAIEGTITRRSILFLAGDAQAICPQCIPNPTPSATSSPNVCDRGARAGSACDVGEVVTVDGTEYRVSTSCPPAAAEASLLVSLSTEIRLTTGASAGCDFVDTSDGLMGTAVVPVPSWPEPTYPKVATGAAVAVSVCRLPTGNASIDSALGLPTGTSTIHALDSSWLPPNQPHP